MGTKERRERERQELRQGILAAARDIAGCEGWQAVTIRRVADRVEYSPPMIYEHFASKEAILHELVREGYKLLLAEMQGAVAAERNPAARVLALTRAYWEFAWQQPELYQVMHGLGGVPFCADAAPAAPPGQPLSEADTVFDVTLAALRDLPSRPPLGDDDLAAAVMVLWSTLHGLVALTMAGRIDGGRECAAKLLDRAVGGFLSSNLV